MVVKGELVGLTLGPERLRAIAAMRERPELCSCNERAHQSVLRRKQARKVAPHAGGDRHMD